jgi:hypothetical protein
MTEVRPLTEKELLRLVEEAPDTETRNLKFLIKDIYGFFRDKAIEQEGIIINKRPIYFGAITFNHIRNRFELWTVVNKDVKEQFSLYKIAKRIALHWAKFYGQIYATMEKINLKNIEWTKRIGFIPIQETDRTITLKLGGV